MELDRTALEEKGDAECLQSAGGSLTRTELIQDELGPLGEIGQRAYLFGNFST